MSLVEILQNNGNVHVDDNHKVDDDETDNEDEMEPEDSNIKVQKPKVPPVSNMAVYLRE